MKERNASLKEQLQTRDNLPVIEMEDEFGQPHQNDENCKICLVLPKYKFDWFKQVDKMNTIFAVILGLLAIIDLWLVYKTFYSNEYVMEIINKYRDKRTEKWEQQLTYLGLQEDKINEMQNKLEISEVNAKEIETRFTVLLNNFEHEDMQLKLIEKKIPSKNDLKLMSKPSLEEHLYELENNEPKLLNQTLEFHSVHDSIKILASDLQWTIDTKSEVSLKLQNRSEMLNSGNTSLEHLDSNLCQYVVHLLQERNAKVHETLVKVNQNYELISHLSSKVAKAGNTYAQRYNKVRDVYYMGLVRIHRALMETEVCFPRLNKLHKYTLVMYGIDKRCVTNVVRHLRKSELVVWPDGKDSWLFINSKPVVNVRKRGPPEYLVPIYAK